MIEPESEPKPEPEKSNDLNRDRKLRVRNNLPMIKVDCSYEVWQWKTIGFGRFGPGVTLPSGLIISVEVKSLLFAPPVINGLQMYLNQTSPSKS